MTPILYSSLSLNHAYRAPPSTASAAAKASSTFSPRTREGPTSSSTSISPIDQPSHDLRQRQITSQHIMSHRVPSDVMRSDAMRCDPMRCDAMQSNHITHKTTK
ncbi:hypothetical protein MFRU_005g02630 [Monilinia fructicola]|nr:hypothetical protein MFRU_005g02630 [Monilinia fructicola]